MPLVFVYGTLKRNKRLHQALNNPLFIDQGYTIMPLRLVDAGAFPVALKTDSGRPVQGEIYKVTEETRKRLDMIEGVPNMYTRETIYAKTNDGQIQACEIYLGTPEAWGNIDLPPCPVNTQGRYEYYG